MKTGLFIGRFQPFHKGHLHLILKAAKEVDLLYIGIGSSNKTNKDNPFPTSLRKKFINATLKNKIKNYKIILVPDFPKDKDWSAYLEKKIKPISILYISDKKTSHEYWVIKCFKDKCRIKKFKYYKKINATDIRERIRTGKRWKHLVPEEVIEILTLAHSARVAL